MFVPEVREDLRGLPPFAPAYCRYSFGMAKFVCTLSRWMTLGDVSAVSGLGWDTVKAIVKMSWCDQTKTVCGQSRTACDQTKTARKLRSRSVAEAEQIARLRPAVR